MKPYRRLFTILFSLFIIFSPPPQALANSGYSFADGTLTITTSEGTTAWRSIAPAQVTKVVLESGVTTIGQEAFQNCSNLTNVNLTSCTELTTIGNSAFQGCSNLTSVDLSSCTELTTIGERAFFDCGSLASITLPASVTSIGNSAFRDCSKLASVDLSSCTGLTTISEWAFYNCGSLASITLPASVTSIGNQAFQKTGLTSVDLSGCAGLTAISEQAFYECGSLKSIKLPNSLQSIGNQAFRQTGLTSVDLSKCTGLTAISEQAFMSCGSLESIKWPDKLQSIGEQAFQQTGLTNVDLSNCTELTTIGQSAFQSCGSLASVSLPPSVTKIGETAFNGCTQLENCTLACPKAPTLGQGAFTTVSGYNTPLTNITISVPKYAAGYDQGDWKLYSDNSKITYTLPGGLVHWALPEELVPVYGEVALTSINDETIETYTAAAAWEPALLDGNKFAPAAAYKATITLTAKEGYTVQGVPENYFTLEGAKSVTNAAAEGDTVTITATFPATGGPVLTAEPTSLSFTTTEQQSLTLTNSGNDAATNLAIAEMTSFTAAFAPNFNNTLASGSSVTLTVQPKDDLTAGNHEETLTITSAEGARLELALAYKPPYAITVNGGSASISQAAAGESVTITAAAAPSGQQFSGWTIVPTVTFTQGTTAASSPATFLMPAQAVTATATFRTTSTSSSGGGGSNDSGSTTTPSTPQQIQQAVTQAAEGATVAVNLPTDGTLPSEVLESLAGRDVTVEVSAGELTWIINGTDIPSGVSLAALNLGAALNAATIPASVTNAITGAVSTIQLSLAHEGDFGLSITLQAPLGKENSGYWANLYYYSPREQQLIFQTAARIGDDGNAQLRFTHASDYAIVIDRESHAPQAERTQPFTDVRADDWYYTAVLWAYDTHLMRGVTDTTFAPNDPVTRAQVWTVLARRAGADPIASNPWYTASQKWAIEHAITDGTAPEEAITRQQLLTMLWRNAGSPPAHADLSPYTDAQTIAPYAQEAMQWGVQQGILTGTSATTLSPEEHCTRAQLAAILQRI